MIKNIISDIGNVLYEFDTEGFLNKYIEENDKAYFFSSTFGNKNWSLMDKGDITFKYARDLFIKLNPRYKNIINDLFNSNLTLCLNKSHNNISLLTEYKNKGYIIYYLSNMPSETFESLRKETNFFDTVCCGGVISAHVNMIKPDRDIYEYFLNKFNLNANECLFIDDNINNVNTALNIGINAIQLLKIDNMKSVLENSINMF